MGGGGGGWGGGVVAMAMTWNVHVAPGNGSLAISPHKLMGPKPRPVPPLSVTDSKILNVMWYAGGIGNA